MFTRYSILDIFPLLHHQDYKTYLDFVLAMENRKEPQVCNQQPSCCLCHVVAVSLSGSAVFVSATGHPWSRLPRLFHSQLLFPSKGLGK